MTARIILLEGGPPWGFRMTSGAENSNIPLKISRVNPGSKAAQKGIREGDIITSINDQPSMKLNPTEAQKLLKQAGANLKLGLNENGAKSNSKQRPKTQGQLENSKTENEADLKEAPTEPGETPEEFSTVKKKGRRGRRKHKVNPEISEAGACEEPFKLRDNSEETLNRIMGITEHKNEAIEHSTEGSVKADESANEDVDKSYLVIPDIANYPEYLNPFNNDEDDIEKRKSNVVKVTVTELGESSRFETDGSIHSSMTTLTDESGSSRSRRRRRRRKLKVQIGSVENVPISTAQYLDNAKNSSGDSVLSKKEIVQEVECKKESSEALSSQVPSKNDHHETTAPFSNLFCPSFMSSKTDDKNVESDVANPEECETRKTNPLNLKTVNYTPSSIPGRKKKRKNKNNKITDGLEIKKEPTSDGSNISETKENSNGKEIEKDVSCGKLKNIFSRKKSKEEDVTEKKPVDEPVIVPTRIVKETEIKPSSVIDKKSSAPIPEETKTQTKTKKKDKKKEIITEKNTEQRIQFADIVKDTEGILLTEIKTIQTLTKTVDRANEIVHLDDAHLQHAIKTDFITMRDHKQNENNNERGKRWKCEEKSQPDNIDESEKVCEQYKAIENITSTEQKDDPKESNDVLGSEENNQTEKDCKQIDDLFNQILMENDINDIEHNEEIIEKKSHQSQETASITADHGSVEVTYRTSETIKVDKRESVHKDPMPITHLTAETSGLKNITVTQPNNGGKDILEIKPQNLSVNPSCLYDHNLITSTCYQKNHVIYALDSNENRTPCEITSKDTIKKSEEISNTVGESNNEIVPKDQSVLEAEENFEYFDESDDEDKTLTFEDSPVENLKPNDINNTQNYNNLSPKNENTVNTDVVCFEEDEILQNLLNNLMLGEEARRCHPIDTEVDKSGKGVETDNVCIEEYIDDLEENLGQKSYEEVVIKKEYNVRSMPETCYISVPGCRYLDVITEEASDISDSERNRVISAIEVSDVEDDNTSKGNEPVPLINEMDSESSDGNGIDISWQGKPLEEIDDIEIVYEEDSPNDSALEFEREQNKKVYSNNNSNEEAKINLPLTKDLAEPNLMSKEQLQMYPPYKKEIKTVQIKVLEKPQRAKILATKSPKTDRKLALKKKREAFFSESLDILNTNFSLYGSDEDFTPNVEADLSNNYPDLINVRNSIEKTVVNVDQNTIEQVPPPEESVKDESTRPQWIHTEHDLPPYQNDERSCEMKNLLDNESKENDNFTSPINEIKKTPDDSVSNTPINIGVTIAHQYKKEKIDENPQTHSKKYDIENSNKEERVDEISNPSNENSNTGEIPMTEIKVNPICQRQTSSSSDTTQSTEKNRPYKVSTSKMKSLKEMAIDNLLIQPNGFETLLDIGIPIHEILEDLGGSNETLSNIDNETIESYDRTNFQESNIAPLLTSMDHFIPMKIPTPPPRRDSFIRMELGNDYGRNDYAVPSSSILTPQSCPLSPRSTSSISSIAYPINQLNDQWLGLPSEDPQVLVCLSPSQSSSSKPLTPKEVSGLIDLHQKFMDRRGYHESRGTSSISTPDSGQKTPHKKSNISNIVTSTEETTNFKRDGGNETSNETDFYTPELLQEAANLLSLKHYHDCRQRKMAYENSVKKGHDDLSDEIAYENKSTKSSEVRNNNSVTSVENKKPTELSTVSEAEISDHSNTKTIKQTEMDNKFENESSPRKLLALIQENKQETCVLECIPEREVKDMHNVDEPLYSTNQSKFQAENTNTLNRSSSKRSERNMCSSHIPTRNLTIPSELPANPELKNPLELNSEGSTNTLHREETTFVQNIGPNRESTVEIPSSTNQSNSKNAEYDNINTSIQREIEKLESFDFETLLKNFEEKGKPSETIPVGKYDKTDTEDKAQNSVIVQYKISKKGDIAELNNNYDFEKQEVIKRDTSKVIVQINKITTKDNINIVEEKSDSPKDLFHDDKDHKQIGYGEHHDDNTIPFATNDIGVQTIERREKKSKIPVVKKNPIGLPVAVNQPKSAPCTHQKTSHHHKKCLHVSTSQVQKSKSEELQKSKSSKSNTQMESMYNEYMKEISAKKDRRKKRMIKLEEKSRSLTNIKETINASDIYTTSIKVKNQLENEFMNKVQQRMNKYGINMKDYEVTNDYFSSDDDCDVREVPKHLQEFIDISQTGPQPIRRSKHRLVPHRGSLLIEIDSVLNGFLSHEINDGQDDDDNQSLFWYMDQIFNGFLSNSKGLRETFGVLPCISL
ncbi:hypothetical protein M8J75_004361 [Diaphorina citri]|nr:hypothetical protein M8J75_004361 [Diaphorina citri]